MKFLFARTHSIDEVAKSFSLPAETILSFLQKNIEYVSKCRGPIDVVDKTLMLRVVKLGDGHILLQRLEKAKGRYGYKLVLNAPWWTVLVLKGDRAQ